MADRLTQLQDCLDDLMTQMYASLRYIQSRHSLSLVEDQPDMTTYTIPGPPPTAPATASQRQSAPGESNATLVNGNTNATTDAGGSQIQPLTQSQPAAASDPTATPQAAPPEVFQSALRELAQDLILKEQQIEHLVNNLPGIGSSEADQERRIRELQCDMKEVQIERDKAQDEKEGMMGLLGGVVGRIKRVR